MSTCHTMTNFQPHRPDGLQADSTITSAELGDPPNVADRYADLLRALPRGKRAGLIGRISQGFYDGWHPSRTEVADLVAVELGLLTIDEGIERQRQRRIGREPAKNLIPVVVAYSQYH